MFTANMAMPHKNTDKRIRHLIRLGNKGNGMGDGKETFCCRCVYVVVICAINAIINKRRRKPKALRSAFSQIHVLDDLRCTNKLNHYQTTTFSIGLKESNNCIFVHSI